MYSGNLYGGVETYLVTLARLRHLCPAVEPEFALCFPGRLWDELTATGVPVHDLGAVRLSRPWSVWRARRRLARLLRPGRFAAAVTHACWPHAAFAPAVRRAGVRLVNAAHDAVTGRHPIDRRAARTRPDAVVANSRFTAAAAGNVFPGVETSVVYLPVAPPAVADRAATRRDVRAELDTSADAVVVLQASRLERWKGAAVHVEALGGLRDRPGWAAWFAGGPQKPGEAEYLGELKAAVARLGVADRVRFLGQRADVSRLAAAADVYCQPNTGPEPFGISFVEALHAGLPVVTSNCGGAAEIVTPDCGVLVPPGDAAAVAAALGGLLTDPGRRAALSAAGPPRAADRCDPGRQTVRLGAAIGDGVRA